MNARISGLAAQVLNQSSRSRPADAVLRETLRSQSGLTAVEAAELTHAVFAFYRWKGWLADAAPGPTALHETLALAERFARAPDSFPDSELVSKAIPEWAPSVMEVAPDFVRALQSEPRLWLRAKRAQGGSVGRRLGHCSAPFPEAAPEALVYAGKQDLFVTPEFQSGAFEVQDLSSQVVGLVCAPEPGQQWWDACAGEGGKALHLSDLMGNKGLLWVSDRAEWRLKKLKRRAARAGMFNYRSRAWDGSAALPTRTGFDGVLVDAPCSGVGTWARNPHARWTTQPADIQELKQLQTGLLHHAASAVKPGGRLVYSVCTLSKPETDEVANDFEKQHPAFTPEAISNPLQTGSASRRLWLRPQDSNSNGMFICVWRKGN